MISRPKFTIDRGVLRIFWVTGEGGPDGDVDSATFSNGEWVKDLEQRDDKEIWTIDYTSMSGDWFGVFSEPYTVGVRVVTRDSSWYILADRLPTEKEPERYVPPVAERAPVSLESIVIGIPLGIILGSILAVAPLSRRKRFIILR